MTERQILAMLRRLEDEYDRLNSARLRLDHNGTRTYQMDCLDDALHSAHRLHGDLTRLLALAAAHE